jgi:hypothetical protein
MINRKIGIGFESRMFKGAVINENDLNELVKKCIAGIKDKYWVAYTLNKENVQKINQLLFKSYNVEDKGNDITK